jgi:hypothetical protein
MICFPPQRRPFLHRGACRRRPRLVLWRLPVDTKAGFPPQRRPLPQRRLTPWLKEPLVPRWQRVEMAEMVPWGGSLTRTNLGGSGMEAHTSALDIPLATGSTRDVTILNGAGSVT